MSNSQELADIIRPIFKEYDKYYLEQNIEKIMEFYHPEAVTVQKGKTSWYGKEALAALNKEFFEMAGKTTTKIEDDVYTGTSDGAWIVCRGKYVADSEKLGQVKTIFNVIYKKEGENWLIYHEEFETDMDI